MKRLAQNKMKWLLAITLILGSFLPTQAIAHPHVVIEGWSDVVFSDDGKIIAINVEWRFDENYSEASIEGLDTNNDGSYSSEELEILTRENLKALQEYDYFYLCQA